MGTCEVEVGGLGGIAEGDVEGGCEGEGVYEVFEGVLVCGSAVYVGHEVFRRCACAGGESAGDEEGLDFVLCPGCGLCFCVWVLDMDEIV